MNINRINVNQNYSFGKNEKLVSEVNDSNLSGETKYKLESWLYGYPVCDYSNMTAADVLKQIIALQEVLVNPISENREIRSLNLNKELLNLQETNKKVITVTDVPKEKVINMMKGFFANNSELEDLLAKSDFAKYGKDGLPLTYPRKNFIHDLNNLLKDLTKDEQEGIAEKLGIKLLKNGERIWGYDGVINLNELSNKGVEGKVLFAATEFIKNNSINTGDTKLDKALNSLIQGMPEFINIIGKQQRMEHDYPIDIHMLCTLKEVISNPNYKKLTDEEKFCLKFATIIHDIAKAEGMADPSHPLLSALYARDILNKNHVQLPKQTKDRIYELIFNHHWLVDYNTCRKDSDNIAVLFRRSGDLSAVRIMTDADLKSVDAKHVFYNKYKSALDDSMQLPVDNALKRINSNGQLFLTNKIIDKSKLPIVNYNGKEYNVINLSESGINSDLSRYGFEPETTIDNLRIFFHALDEKNLKESLQLALNSSDPSNQAYLQASYISVKNRPMLANNKFGVSLTLENVNIANASLNAQTLGLGTFANIITDKDSKHAQRTLIPNAIKSELNLTDSEYSQLYAKIQRYKFAPQLDCISAIKIGNKKLTGKQIKQAILKANDLMLADSSISNGVNLYAPKINAICAKVNSIKEIPQELLDFAEVNNFPILIFGE